VAHMTDADIDHLRRGGHDAVKIFAAYAAASNHKGQPTVILAQTKKGYGMGEGQGRMGTHQQKKLDKEALRAFRDRFALPLTDAEVEEVRFHSPGPASPEIRYLRVMREKLGGFVPARRVDCPSIAVPSLASFARLLEGTRDREQSTTMVFVQMLSQLLKDPQVGKRVVPIVADEARTFGMQSLFRQVGIYSAVGQLYEPEDKAELLYYKEAKDGQILEEGITEAGALSSWIAAATSYSTNGEPMLPFYIYYSMFGFQRVGDLIWAAADQRSRGFLVGATAGRTTLSGEGLQHEDGSSHLVATTIPNVRAWDPCYGYELAVIVQDGARRMLEAQEDVFYYLTVMNENYVHAALPAGSEQGILRGMYKLRSRENATVRLLGSGTILREAIAAGELLDVDWGVAADIWSVTSFSELARDGMQAERANRLHPLAPRESSWVEQQLGHAKGPVVAASDYVRGVAEQIRAYVPARYTALGTDGFGRSDTRAALRDFFEVSREHIAVSALAALADEGSVERKTVAAAIERYGIDPARPPAWKR
jgi:pyruvate dehydrogenase E1 component